MPSRPSPIRKVKSFDELIGTPFTAGVNALCWERPLLGDFAAVIERLATPGGIVAVSDATLENLDPGPAGEIAIDQMLSDLRLLRAQGLLPELNCIRGYPREEDPGVIRTDVYSFHVDSATGPADTWLCTYHGAPSEGLPNDQAIRRAEIPETRAALLADYGGGDDDGFVEYLADHCYDLHYLPGPRARPYSLGQGNLWRIATAWPGSPVPPCIHRAPDSLPGAVPRLLLIA